MGWLLTWSLLDCLHQLALLQIRENRLVLRGPLLVLCGGGGGISAVLLSLFCFMCFGLEWHRPSRRRPELFYSSLLFVIHHNNILSWFIGLLLIWTSEATCKALMWVYLFYVKIVKPLHFRHWQNNWCQQKF